MDIHAGFVRVVDDKIVDVEFAGNKLNIIIETIGKLCALLLECLKPFPACGSYLCGFSLEKIVPAFIING